MRNKVFEYILGKDNTYGRHEIHNIAALYKLCLAKGKIGSYNEVNIGDILVDAENIEAYEAGIEGYRIVETLQGHRVEGEYALIMNYPADGGEKNHVKIIFENRKDFWRQYYKLTDAERTKPIIIAGDWEPTPNETEFQSQCIIHRPRQIYYVNEQ